MRRRDTFLSVNAVRTLLLLGLLGCGAVPSGHVAYERSVPLSSADLEARVRDLDSEDSAVRHRAARDLRAGGEEALPLLEQAARGKSPSAHRARRLAERILSDLVASGRARNDAYLASRKAPLPEGVWMLVADGRLAATGPSRAEVLASGKTDGARHRYLWRSGEPVAPRTVELGALGLGDAGAPVVSALGGSPDAFAALDADAWFPLAGGIPEDWKDAAVAVSEPEALRLGLAAYEIPGSVTVRSRVGAGVLAVAHRARGLVRKNGGMPHEVEIWIIPESEHVVTEEKHPLPQHHMPMPGREHP
jgi:hypothetical protein